MSDVPPSDVHDDDLPDMTAGEFALGLLDGDAGAAATRRVLAEPAFARSVEAWRLHFAQLFAQWPEMPAPDLFARIERSLHGSGAATVATLPVRTPSKLWPGIAALSSLAAAALLVVLFTRPLAVPPRPQAPATPRVVETGPTLVASITPTAKGAPVTVVYNAGAGSLRLTEASLADAKRTAELWVIPAGGTPHSLGLLAAHGGTALTLTAENRARITAGATLAVSLEPIGGSTTGLPTGPVVATGALSRV
ncbi:anti-sigma factor [Sphingomonas glacialis]|uniref:Anti-sigma factor n=1 Tax=Sphingomonas glacialis TaxID=658225 RepID=A0A502FTL6_9SPHN|nr:anti-sigma factor [Sphingomonas glacialis]TPG52825.1 anti-sigma factor [Sphingomonas glacialis]